MAQGRKPNIVYFHVDNLGYGELGCFRRFLCAFWCGFSAHDVQREAAMSATVFSFSPPPQLPTAFVVDDEEVIAATIAMILKMNGFNAKPFREPLKVLEASRIEAPDLLITDVLMPEMSGIDLAIQIRKVYPACRVLLFSGQAATADLLEAANADGHDFKLISKPVHPNDLLATIEQRRLARR